MAHLEGIVPKAEQEKWLHDLDYSPLGDGVLGSESSPRHHMQFFKLLDHPNCDQILRLTSRYIRTCIMYPLATIQNYWSPTCFTEPGLQIRINMADQVTLSIW